MISTLFKSGNSLSLRIPKPFAQQLGLSIDTQVELSIENGKLVLAPHQKSLKMLLDGIDKNNLHHEVSDDSPQGYEIW